MSIREYYRTGASGFKFRQLHLGILGLLYIPLGEFLDIFPPASNLNSILYRAFFNQVTYLIAGILLSVAVGHYIILHIDYNKMIRLARIRLFETLGTGIYSNVEQLIQEDCYNNGPLYFDEVYDKAERYFLEYGMQSYAYEHSKKLSHAIELTDKLKEFFEIDKTCSMELIRIPEDFHSFLKSWNDINVAEDEEINYDNVYELYKVEYSRVLGYVDELDMMQGEMGDHKLTRLILKYY